MGIFKLTEYAIRKYIERHKFLCKKVKISFSQLSFILSIYNNPVMADRDHSATMSCVEAVFFALAMSLDGMFGGLGAGFTGKNIYFTVMGSFVVSFCAVLSEDYLIRLPSEARVDHDHVLVLHMI